MSADKKWRLIAYDIRDPKRYRKVFKILRGTGHSVQYSVFRCRLDDREAEKLRWRLAKVMDPIDSLLVVDLCPSCAGKVISRNHVDGWSDKPATHMIFAPTEIKHQLDRTNRVALKIVKSPTSNGDPQVEKK